MMQEKEEHKFRVPYGCEDMNNAGFNRPGHMLLSSKYGCNDSCFHSCDGELRACWSCGARKQRHHYKLKDARRWIQKVEFGGAYRCKLAKGRSRVATSITVVSS